MPLRFHDPPETRLIAQRQIWPAVAICSAILFGVPLLFLFYGGLGTALAGLSGFALLIFLQYLLLRPIWRRIQQMRHQELAKSAERSCRAMADDPF